MNSLIDFKEFNKINSYFPKNINKITYDFSIDYPLNIFPKIVKYLRKNIACKTHLIAYKTYIDYRDKTGRTIIIKILIDIDGLKVEFSFAIIFSEDEDGDYYNFNEYIFLGLFLIYKDYQKFINNISPFERVLDCSSDYGISGAHQIGRNLTKIFNELYKFNKTDIINLQNYIDNNLISKIIDNNLIFKII
jgi:hypothetical protein